MTGHKTNLTEIKDYLSRSLVFQTLLDVLPHIHLISLLSILLIHLGLEGLVLGIRFLRFTVHDQIFAIRFLVRGSRLIWEVLLIDEVVILAILFGDLGNISRVRSLENSFDPFLFMEKELGLPRFEDALLAPNYPILPLFVTFYTLIRLLSVEFTVVKFAFIICVLLTNILRSGFAQNFLGLGAVVTHRKAIMRKQQHSFYRVLQLHCEIFAEII